MVQVVAVNRHLYPTDLTDSQWDIIQPLVPPGKSDGGPLQLVLNAILYVTVSAVQWRPLPLEYPKWQTVYTYFRTERGR